MIQLIKNAKTQDVLETFIRETWVQYQVASDQRR